MSGQSEGIPNDVKIGDDVPGSVPYESGAGTVLTLDDTQIVDISLQSERVNVHDAGFGSFNDLDPFFFLASCFGSRCRLPHLNIWVGSGRHVLFVGVEQKVQGPIRNRNEYSDRHYGPDDGPRCYFANFLNAILFS